MVELVGKCPGGLGQEVSLLIGSGSVLVEVVCPSSGNSSWYAYGFVGGCNLSLPCFTLFYSVDCFHFLSNSDFSVGGLATSLLS